MKVDTDTGNALSLFGESDKDNKVLLKLQGRKLEPIYVNEMGLSDKILRFLARFGVGPFNLAKIVSHINELTAEPDQEALLASAKLKLYDVVSRYNKRIFCRHVSAEDLEALVEKVGQQKLGVAKTPESTKPEDSIKASASLGGIDDLVDGLLKADTLGAVEKLANVLEGMFSEDEPISDEISEKLELAKSVLDQKLATCGLTKVLNSIGSAETQEMFEKSVKEFNELLDGISLTEQKEPSIQNLISMIKMAIDWKTEWLNTDAKDPSRATVVKGVGKGIENGGNSCYLNSVIQALRFVPLDTIQGLNGLVKAGERAGALDKICNSFGKRTLPSTQEIASATKFLNENLDDITQIYRDKNRLKTIPQQHFPKVKKSGNIRTDQKIEAVKAVLGRANVRKALSKAELTDLRTFFTEIKDEVNTIRDARASILKMHRALKKKMLTVSQINSFRNFLIDKCEFASNLRRGTQEDAAEVCAAIFRATGVKEFTCYMGVEPLKCSILNLPLQEGVSGMASLVKDIQLEDPSKPPPRVLPIQPDRYPEGSAGKNMDPIAPDREIQVNVFGGSPAKYRLASVVVHSGESPKSGHYYTYLPKDDGSWVEFNDSWVGHHPAPAVDVEVFAAKNCLLYFYELIQEG